MTTTFVDQATVISATWLNAADAIVAANAIAALRPLVPSANKFAVYTALAAATLYPITDFALDWLGSADSGAALDVLDPQLAAIAALVPVGPYQFPYFTDVDSAALATVSAFVLTLLDDADAAHFLTTLGFSAYFQTLIGAANGAALPFLLLAGGTMSGDITMANHKLITAKTVSFNGIVDNSDSGTTKTIDFTLGQYQKVTMTGNCTFTLTAPTGPSVVHLDMTQSSGGHTMTLPASVKWPEAYTADDKLLSVGASARDLLILRWNGTDYIPNLFKNCA